MMMAMMMMVMMNFVRQTTSLRNSKFSFLEMFEIEFSLKNRFWLKYFKIILKKNPPMPQLIIKYKIMILNLCHNVS